MVAVALVLTTLFLPLIPPIIAAALPFQPLTWARSLLVPAVQASALLLLTSQLHLNHRQRTFGANYRTVACLDFAAVVLGALPIMFSGWWGRWEQMGSFGCVEIGAVMGRAALAWQAWRYRGVEQREGGDE